MKRRKFIAAIVLLGGVVLFFVIIGASPSSSRPLVMAEAGSGQSGSLNYAAATGSDALPGNTAAADASGTAADGNLTDALIQNYAQNVLQMNNGFAGANPTGTNPVSFPSVDETSQLLSQAVGQKIPYKTYTSDEVLTSNDNSTSSQLQYLASITAITRKDFGSFNTPISQMVSDFVDHNDPSAINHYIGIANQEVADLLALRAPSDWTAWHISNINLWEEKIAVFSAIVGSNADPVKAIAGLEQINDVVQKNNALTTTLADKYNSLVS